MRLIRIAGFSLLELWVTLAIIGIVVAFSVPSYLSLQETTRTTLLREQLFRALQVARQASFTQSARVTVCHSQDQKTCSGSWNQGFIVVTDDHKVLLAFTMPTHAGQLQARFFPAGRDDVQFFPSGKTAADNGTFWYCSQRDLQPLFAVIVNQVGRARVVLPDKNHSIVDDEGKALACEKRVSIPFVLENAK